MRCLFILCSMMVWTTATGGPNQLRPGETFQLGKKTAEVVRATTLPFVQDEYTARFRFDSVINPKLKQLREQYRLDAVVASGQDEFEKQVLLNHWAHRRFLKFGQPSNPARGALEILEGIEKGNTYFCAQYVQVLASAAASLGWNNRVLALRRHQGANARGGSTEHSTTEIWSNQYAKWIMLDPTSNMYLETNGVPLNAWEIRQEWFYRGGTNLTFVVGKDRKKYRKADLPIVLGRFKDFGELTVEPDELDKYGFIGYIPNTDLMDSGYDYGQMFIVKDDLCAGTKWHERLLPKNPATDPYFPLNQVAVELKAERNLGSDYLQCSLKTFTPNFQTFELRQQDGQFFPIPDKFNWMLRNGTNKIEIRSKNSFGVTGPPSLVEVILK